MAECSFWNGGGIKEKGGGGAGGGEAFVSV